MGNTVMRTLCIPFIMYEHKCYKLETVKMEALYLYLWERRCSFQCQQCDAQKNGVSWIRDREEETKTKERHYRCLITQTQWTSVHFIGSHSNLTSGLVVTCGLKNIWKCLSHNSAAAPDTYFPPLITANRTFLSSLIFLSTPPSSACLCFRLRS